MYHILVVDDEKTIRESLKIYLEEEDYRVTLCEKRPAGPEGDAKTGGTT